MKTITVNTDVYKFDELSESAKENAINELSDINVYYNWWDCTYEDALQVGITITEFDLDRNRHAKTTIYNPIETAELIMENHGVDCTTYKTAQAFLNEVKPLTVKREKILDILNRHNVSNWFDKLDNIQQELNDTIQDLEDDFKQSITEDYSIMLQHEYEYLSSSESIIETIEANDYDFTINGKLFNCHQLT